MSRSSVVDRLGTVPMFAACSKRELQQLARLVTETDVRQGTQLTVEGAVGREFMIIISGTAEASRGGITLGALGPGDWFGEIALLDEGPRTATVTATTDMTVAVLSPREFNQALDELPSLAVDVARGLVRRLRQLEQPAVG